MLQSMGSQSVRGLTTEQLNWNWNWIGIIDSMDMNLSKRKEKMEGMKAWRVAMGL